MNGAMDNASNVESTKACARCAVATGASVILGNSAMSKKTVKVKSNAQDKRVVLLVTGSKGNAFRVAERLDNGNYKLVQSNVGLSYDGAIVSAKALAEGKLDKQARLELGCYIAGKGSKASIKELSMDEARKLASKQATFVRNGKEIAVAVASLATQYTASVETLGNGVEHFFQLESVKLKGKNEKHFASLVKG